jgi:hypothetical protein
MYCGNNRRSTKLLNGFMGSPYQCLRRGIYIGLNQPYDEEYNGEYDPIDTTRLYCGTNNIIPQGYDRIGYSHECHRIGVGIGKKTKASRSQKRKRRSRKRNIRSRKRNNKK